MRETGVLMLTLESPLRYQQLSALTKRTNPVCSLHPQRDAYINTNKPDLIHVLLPTLKTQRLTSTNESEVSVETKLCAQN